MLLIVAGSGDAEAYRLAERWSVDDARVLTVADLSQPGWCLRPGSPGGSLALHGERFRTTDIDGVLTRMAAIDLEELVDIHPEDRAYVAAEMHAFLLAWLSELQCPVINRPTPRSLVGPALPLETWLGRAARLGIPVRPARRQISPGEPPRPSVDGVEHVAVVVGDAILGEIPPDLRDSARRLARTAEAHLLSVGFDSTWRLVDVNPRPALDSPDVIDALRNDLVPVAAVC